MGHSACDEEMDDLEAFLTERLPPLKTGSTADAATKTDAGAKAQGAATTEKGDGKSEL